MIRFSRLGKNAFSTRMVLHLDIREKGCPRFPVSDDTAAVPRHLHTAHCRASAHFDYLLFTSSPFLPFLRLPLQLQVKSRTNQRGAPRPAGTEALGGKANITAWSITPRETMPVHFSTVRINTPKELSQPATELRITP